MKKLFQLVIIICLSICYNTTFAQDMSGEWNGILRQSEGGVSAYYYFVLNLKQKGNVITGTSKVSLADKPNFYAIMELKGKFKDDVLTFVETKIIEQKTFEGLEWCIKKAKLNFTIKKDGFCIEGTWSGKSGNGNFCSPGTVKVCKIVPMANHSEEPKSSNKQQTYAAIQLRTNTKFRKTFSYQFD